MHYSRTLRVAVMAFSILLIAAAFPMLLPQGIDGCPKPNAITVSNVTDSSADISWQQSDTVNAVSILITDLSDQSILVEQDDVISPFSVSGLVACGRYRISLQSSCDVTESDFTAGLDFEADGCCRLPTDFGSFAVGDTFITLTWDVVMASDSYTVRYRLEGEDDDDWRSRSGIDASLTLEDLIPCTPYEVQIVTVCGNDSSGFSDIQLLETLGCGPCTENDYCTAAGFDATGIWMDSIQIANVRVKSGSNDGYFALATEQTALERGRSYTFWASPGFAEDVDTCPVFIQVWLDLNQDGTFNDSTELLLDTVNLNGLGAGGIFALADTLPRGITRMRFALKPQTATDTIPPGACGLFDFGEVEDYCIRIDEPCPIAENLDTISVDEQEAVVGWSSLDVAFGYLWANGEVGEERGELMPTGDTIVELGDLDPCTEYAFYLISVCEQDTNGQVLVFRTDCETSVRDLSPALAEIKVFPNPFRSDFSLQVTSDERLEGHIRVMTATGQMVHNQEVDIAAGDTFTEEINVLDTAPPGLYLVVLQSGNRLTTQKVVKAGL